MTQTLAIFYDAYRSLNAKKMFWIVLFLSVFVAGSFACMGINERGVKIVFWQFDHGLLNSGTIEPAVFYKLLFKELAIEIWLAWLATILALVSTAGIFPDLINSESIHLLVSKPIGRLRLFLTQYAAGLLFVTLQVTLFTLVCFLVIGLRGGAWEPGLFVAVPVVVCFFSYLFCICVLLGLVTRSTLAALLLTLLFWFLTFGVGVTENVLLAARSHERHGNAPPGAVQMQPTDDQKTPAERAKNPVPASRAATEADTPTGDDSSALKRGSRVPRAVGRALLKAVAEPSAEDHKEGTGRTLRGGREFNPAGNKHAQRPASSPDADDEKENSAKLKLAYDVSYVLKTILPKTTETIGLLERSLYDMADIPAGVLGQPYEHQKAQREVLETLRERTVWWVVGTSLGFEALVLCCAGFIFCRRDY